MQHYGWFINYLVYIEKSHLTASATYRFTIVTYPIYLLFAVDVNGEKCKFPVVY